MTRRSPKRNAPIESRPYLETVHKRRCPRTPWDCDCPIHLIDPANPTDPVVWDMPRRVVLSDKESAEEMRNLLRQNPAYMGALPKGAKRELIRLLKTVGRCYVDLGEFERAQAECARRKES